MNFKYKMMENQCKVTLLTWEEFESLVMSSSPCMGFGKSDLRCLEESEGDKFLILEAATSETTELRFQTVINAICKEMENLGFLPISLCKGLVLIQYPKSLPVSMIDMTYMQMLWDKFPAECELKWDMVPTETSICRLICAIRAGFD